MTWLKKDECYHHKTGLYNIYKMNCKLKFLESFEITAQSTIAEIVKMNYHAADVFRKYDISYCCGSNLSIESACLMKGVELNSLLNELVLFARNIEVPSTLPFETWTIDFLIDYIVNIHHQSIKTSLPVIYQDLIRFTEHHSKKYPYFITITLGFEELMAEILPHIKKEEEEIFPYLRQVAHAYESNDSLARLLVKTLRKPVTGMIGNEHKLLSEFIYRFRKMTNNYSPPQSACPSHVFVLSKLKELDHDLLQHIFLENEILFPKIIAIENSLLSIQ
jgi:regulator of cell morphogenesis and NO signaling